MRNNVAITLNIHLYVVIIIIIMLIKYACKKCLVINNDSNVYFLSNFFLF